MAYPITFKSGCATTIIAPSGVRILAALEHCAQLLSQPLVVTCGCDSHGPNDPHTKGEAFDVRSHDLPALTKTQLLPLMMQTLSEGPSDLILPKDGGFVTHRFFGWLEQAGEPDEHFHFQQRNGVSYP